MRSPDAGRGKIDRSADAVISPSQACMTESATAALKELNCLVEKHNGQVVSVTCSQISDDHLRHLITCDTLSNLDLQHSRITDVGLVHIGRIRSLKRLHLGHTAVTGPGLRYISSLQNLEALDLTGTGVLIEEAAPHLALLSNLRWLDLRLTPKTEASRAAIDLLRRRLPDLRFHPLGV